MNIKNLMMGAAITFLTFLVIFTGMQTFYTAPEYSDFCGEFRTLEVIETQVQCEDIGGKWTSQDIKCITTPCPQGYCDRDFGCSGDYDSERENYSKNLFIATLVLGIGLLLLGGRLFDLEAVGAGIMGGGILTIFYGSTYYWQYAGDIFRFILSIIGLVAVIYLAYWLNNRVGKRKSKFKKFKFF